MKTPLINHRLSHSFSFLSRLLYAPVPRPAYSKKNIANIYLLGFIISLFIIFFEPFGISARGSWQVSLILIGMGVIFSSSIYLMELVLPWFVKRPFHRWTLLKGALWYTMMTLFVSAVMFFVKSFLAGFEDFSLVEYINVIGRIAGLGLLVSFFVLGVMNALSRQRIETIASNEMYTITSPAAKAIRLNINEVMYIKSDDNYVDIHVNENGKRRKIVFRSSLSNIENQLVSRFTPIYRCHRQYLININFFQIKSRKSRSASVMLKSYEDEIPVSKTYVSTIVDRISE